MTDEVVIATKIGARPTRAGIDFATFGAPVSAGEVALLGVSNHRTWRVERARAIARATAVAGHEVPKYHDLTRQTTRRVPVGRL